MSLIKEGTLLLFSVVEVRDALGHEQIEGAERDGAALERQIAHYALFWACARLDIEYSTTRSSSDRSLPVKEVRLQKEQGRVVFKGTTRSRTMGCRSTRRRSGPPA